MDQIIEKINANWNKNPKADKQLISTVENNLNVKFPDAETIDAIAFCTRYRYGT